MVGSSGESLGHDRAARRLLAASPGAQQYQEEGLVREAPFREEELDKAEKNCIGMGNEDALEGREDLPMPGGAPG